MSVASIETSAASDGPEAVFALIAEYSAEEDFDVLPARSPYEAPISISRVDTVDWVRHSPFPIPSDNGSAAGNSPGEAPGGGGGLNYFVLLLSVFPVFTVLGNLLVVLSGTQRHSRRGGTCTQITQNLIINVLSFLKAFDWQWAKRNWTLLLIHHL